MSLSDGRTIEYVHDPLGRRIAKKINSTVVEKYLWQDRTRLLAVYDGNNALVMRFEYADGRMPAAMTTNDSSVYYLTCDQAGSLRIVTDISGTVVRRLDYDSFGNVISPDNNPAPETPFGFAGGLHDRDTGLVRFGYRDYDPDAGRWTAKDPVRFAGRNSDLYGYCMNDPVNLKDPLGLMDSEEWQPGTTHGHEDNSRGSNRLHIEVDEDGNINVRGWGTPAPPAACDEQAEKDIEELLRLFPEGEASEEDYYRTNDRLLHEIRGDDFIPYPLYGDDDDDDE